MGKHIQTRDSRGLRCPLWQIIGRVRDNRHLVEQLLYRYRNGEEIPHFAGLSSERRSVLFLPLTWICICIFWRHWRGRKCGVDMICSARRCCRFNFTFSRDTRLAAKRAPPHFADRQKFGFRSSQRADCGGYRAVGPVLAVLLRTFVHHSLTRLCSHLSMSS